MCLFSDLFLQNEVDLAMFTTLKDEDLISIGIHSFGARKILLNAIQGNIYFANYFIDTNWVIR